MKSKLDQQIEDAFYYAVNFYNTNDRSIEKQQFCLNEMQKYGLDLDTCIRIQNPVMSVFMMGELMEIGSEITQQHLASITNNIHLHLLSLQPTIQPDVVKELPHIPTLGGNTNGSKARDGEGVNIQVKNVVQDITINGYKGQKTLAMSNYDLEPHDMNYLSGTMPNNSYNFTLVDFSHNPRVGAMGVDYLLKGAPGISSLQLGNTDINLMYQGMLVRPSFNIVKLNLENCNMGDIGANILCHALVSGKLPATKNIDVSGNNIGEDGNSQLAIVVNEAPNTHLAITLEKHNDAGGVWNFIKKAFNYYAEEHSKKLAEDSKAALAVYGDNDWINCKKLIHDTSKEMSMGVVKHSSNVIAQQLIQKAPPQIKGATVGAILVASSIDTAKSVDVENLGYCIAAINKKVEEFIFDKDTMLPENSVGFLGENGVGEYVDF